MAAIACALCLSSAPAAADTTVCSPGAVAGKCQNPQGVAVNSETGVLYVADRGNRRIDVFDASHAFAFAFGWGVANGAPELQSCGPKATPPTGNCLAGLGGGGAGALGEITDVAVDNDPASSSQGDLYVLDGYRVQKFDSEGHFLLAFGGGVITGGAGGTGDLTSGSSQVASVRTTSKRFAVGQTISGAGIPPETKILALGPETITLSKPATASGTGVALSVAEGAGNVAANEVDVLVNKDTNAGSPASPNFAFNTPTPNGPPSRTELNELGELPTNTTCPQLKAAFEALPNVGAGAVACLGEAVVGQIHEYEVEFKGPRYADTDVLVEPANSTGNREVFTEENGSGAAEVCTAAIAASCAAGVQGDGDGQIAESAQLALGQGGTVSVVDCIRPHPVGDCKNRLQRFESSGAFLEAQTLAPGGSPAFGLAIDSGGDAYVSNGGNAIRKYDPAGALLKTLPATTPEALAIDGTDHLFASEFDGGSAVIAEYDPTGATVRRFGYGAIGSQPRGLAHFPAAGEDIYSAESNGVFYRHFAPPGPILALQPCKAEPLGNTHATLVAEINPEGKETKLIFEYVSEANFQAEGFAGASKTTEQAMPETDFRMHKATVEVQGLEPETEYRCRALASNSDGTPPAGPEGKFKTRPGFEFGGSWTAAVGEEEATVFVEGNPLGVPAGGQVEYVTDARYQASGFAEAQSAPTPELDFGASEAMQLRSATLTGLAPGTLYHYRLRARNGSPPEGILCPELKPECPALEHTFRTHPAGAGAPDQRAYELVSPVRSNGDVAVPGNAAGFVETESRPVRIQAAAGSGEAITYTSWTSFGQAEGAQGASQYLSRRGPDGWQTQNISPRGFIWSPLVPPYVGFSPDLAFSAFKTTAPALVAGCQESLETLYLRDSESGQLHCLTPDVPGGPEGGCLVYAGASEDGSRAFLAGRPEGEPNFDYRLYEWSRADEEVRPLSVFPSGETAPVTQGTSFGAAGNRSVGAENCDVARRIARHAISADGSRAFWTYAPDDESQRTQLFARIDGTETVQLDKKEAGIGQENSGDGVFRGASADGSLAYFTAPRRLVTGANPEAGKPDLYRYQLGQAKPLTDLTKGPGPGAVKGVVGISDDGAYVYFVAGAVLSAEPNQAGQKAAEGANNLYLFHEGTTSFIATLSGEDGGDWASSPREMTARVTPDGRHLAFLSTRAKELAGYDNRVAAGEHCRYYPSSDGKVELAFSPLCQQLFLYDAEGGELSCASCNPAGSRPLGPTVLPGWTNGLEGPRFLSDDGARLFFTSFDQILPADESEGGDVYEFERPGTGSCKEASGDFDPVSGGCHYLISAGREEEDENYLLDASAGGRDVFFSTRRRLVGSDPNDSYDVYDYREGGGFPEAPPPPPPCVSSESCKAPAGAAPQPPSAATAGFRGAGNVVASGKEGRCPKGKRKVRRKGKARCAGKGRHAKHRKAKHTKGTKGRADR